MVLSKRERYIAIGVGAAVGLFGLDRPGPLAIHRRDDEIQLQTASRAADDLVQGLADQAHAQQGQEGLGRDAGRRDEVRPGRRRGPGPARPARLVPGGRADQLRPGAQPQRRPSKASSSPPVSHERHRDDVGLAKLLWRVETTTIPMRIVDLNITPHGTGGRGRHPNPDDGLHACAASQGADKLDKPEQARPAAGRSRSRSEGKRVQS